MKENIRIPVEEDKQCPFCKKKLTIKQRKMYLSKQPFTCDKCGKIIGLSVKVF